MTHLLSHDFSYEEQLALSYEDRLAYIEKVRTVAAAQVAAFEVQIYAMIALRDQARYHPAVAERTDA